MKKIRPTSVTIVAWFLILSGAVACWNLWHSWDLSLTNIDFSPLGVPVGIGLLLGNRFCRGCILTFTWLGFVYAIIAAIALAVAPGKVSIDDIHERSLKWLIGFPAIVVLVLILAWLYSALTNQKSRDFFYAAESNN
jgi:ABC-type phosphate transport system permease subunit